MKSEKLIVRFTVAVIITVLLSAFSSSAVTVILKTEYNISGEKPPIANDIKENIKYVKDFIKKR